MIAREIKKLISMGKENKIHEFNPQIYPLRVWVVIKPQFEDINKMFYSYDTNDNILEFEESWFNDINNSACATCYPVCAKEDGQKGMLVVIRNLKSMDVGTITHEAFHIVDYVCDLFGIKGFNFDDGEARAYLGGWCANCIDSVLKGKVK